MDLREFIKKHSHKYCTNRHYSDVMYLSPKMARFARETKDRGEKYFYTVNTDPNDKHQFELGEPIYEYKIIATLTPEEYEELMKDE